VYQQAERGLMKAAFSRYCAAVFLYVVIPSIAASSPLPWIGQHIGEHRGEESSARSRFLLYLPEGYGEREQKWPLIVYLHGASVRGSNPDRIKRYGIPLMVENRKDFPFIVISPQCPAGKRWVDIDPGRVMDILDKVCADYSVDTDRIYLTGVSMGGHGAWYLASRFPERFAAIAPLCGRADTSWVDSLRNIPVWVFHGDRDRVCPKSYSDRMVAALDSLGAEVRYTLYKGAGHNIVTRTYRNEELYEWFLRHCRSRGGLSTR
jgi:predicted peptidase